MMDDATGWIEIYPISDKESQAIALATATEWFYRYPRPKKCIHDNGTEFVGEEFYFQVHKRAERQPPSVVAPCLLQPTLLSKKS